jgi:transposase InsO family protein
VQRQFAVTELNQHWVTDLTYVGTGEGWLQVASMLDACSSAEECRALVSCNDVPYGVCIPCTNFVTR